MKNKKEISKYLKLLERWFTITESGIAGILYDNLSYELFNSERPTFFSASDMQVLSTVFTAPLLPQDFSAVSSNNEIPLTIWISVAVRIRKRANTIGYLDTELELRNFSGRLEITKFIKSSATVIITIPVISDPLSDLKKLFLSSPKKGFIKK